MQMQRRSVLTGLAVASMCPICISRGASAADAHGHEKHWTYEGDGGPDQWGDLKPEFKTCSIGKEQSPINLAQPIHAKLSPLNLKWKEFPLALKNNGHTIQIDVPPGCSLTEGDGEVYNMVNFHFHHPSEHSVDGKFYPMEVHFVHLNVDLSRIKEPTAAATVVGVLFVPGKENAVLKKIWPHMPKTGEKKETDVKINPTGLLPANHDRYRYEGSLTTPGCNEFVHWNVIRRPITASEAQIKQFADLFPNNARPVLPLNRRFLLEG
ncbi:MAG: carbonic anhydrase family protein [Rhodospirillaceae bacterium]